NIDAAMAIGEKIDPLVASGYEGIHIGLGGEPRPAIAVVAPARERRRALVDRSLPMRGAARINAEILRGISLVRVASDGDRRRSPVGARRDELVIFRDPAAQRH